MFDWVKKLAGSWVNKSPGDDYWYQPRGQPTQSGVDVNEDTALTFSTVFAIVSKLSKTMATLPVHVVERVSDRERRPIDHPLNDILTCRANPESTGLSLREALMANLLLWGNAYAEVIRSSDRDRILGLVLLPSREVKMRRTTDTGELYFEQRTSAGVTRHLGPEDVLHIPGLSLNGLTGLPPIGYTREAIGLGMAAAEMSGSFYRNGCFGGGFIQRDPDKIAGKLSAEAGNNVIRDIEKQVGGSKKAFGLALLREGMTFKGIPIPLKDAELLASRRFQRIELCGIFDIPPSKLHDLTEGKYNNVEQQDTAWAKDSLAPWCIRFETAIRGQLLPEGGNLFLRHNLAGLMRGDFTSQMAAFASGRQWGLFSINDCRGMLDMNPIENGDDYLEPLNMAVVGTPRIGLTPPPPPAEREEDEEDEKTPAADLKAHFMPLIRDAAERITAKELKAIDNALKRLSTSGDRVKFEAWLDKFYTEHIPFMVACLSPVAEAFEAMHHARWNPSPLAMAEAYSEQHYDTLMAVAEDPVKMSSVLAAWKRTHAEAIAAGVMTVVNQSVSQLTLSHEEIDNV